ncbi:S8 family serine peptidase [Hyalangium sp.]|uniref:S8 family serine peptidase n=1 Tax=Hyalangium sp. TaxID=2028555 RepID=UPI002D5671C6|nr:S8 family serine peptidase [Hyalangium sp.]HYH99725.1 S8 family serine peptidase [Hyalangium sp.]
MRSMKSWSRLITACLVLASMGALAAPPQLPAQGKLMRSPRPVRGEYLVVLKEKPARGLLSMAVRAGALARPYGARVLTTHETAFRGFLISASEAQAQALAEDPQVEYVQENAIVQVAGLQTPAPWNLDRIDQELLPLSNSYQTDDATNVNVYVIDTGIRESHLEFEGRAQVVFNNIALESGDDFSGHGTAVAGIIGGKTFGVAKKARLNSVKAFSGTGEATMDGLVQAMEWVANNAVTPAIVNLSFTTTGVLPPLDAAADVMANNPGLVVVVAAGNAGIDACFCSPAHLQPDASHPSRARILTVGAIDEAHTRWSTGFTGSNSGACLDLWAPGANIVSAGIASDTATTNREGTSFAAPHVSGVAAILMSQGISPTDIPARLVADASVGQVQLEPFDTASPNLLLYKRPQATPLVNGVATSVSDLTGGQKNFKLEVPAGRPSVVFSLSGGTGDVDLYVRHGQLPETFVYQCRPLRKGNTEKCTMPTPAAGTWFVHLRAHSTYTATLRGQY